MLFFPLIYLNFALLTMYSSSRILWPIIAAAWLTTASVQGGRVGQFIAQYTPFSQSKRMGAMRNTLM